MKGSNNDSWRGRYESQKEIATRLAVALRTTAATLQGLRIYLSKLEEAYTSTKGQADPTFEEIYAAALVEPVTDEISSAAELFVPDVKGEEP